MKFNNLRMKHMTIEIDESLRLKQLDRKSIFINLMFQENCRERLANNQEPYSCVEEYMNRNEKLVLHLYRRNNGIFR